MVQIYDTALALAQYITGRSALEPSAQQGSEINSRLQATAATLWHMAVTPLPDDSWKPSGYGGASFCLVKVVWATLMNIEDLRQHASWRLSQAFLELAQQVSSAVLCIGTKSGTIQI